MDVLSSLPAAWRAHFVDTGRALALVDRNPQRYDQLVTRWAESEPTLAGLRADVVFAEPRGGLTEEQARAMIRIARTDDPDAELAGWSLVWQFGMAIIGMASRQRRIPGSEGPRAAVCTATSEIWRLIHRIDLDANKASIFYAITTKTRRLLLPTPRRIGAIHRNTSAVDDLEDAADQTPLIYRSTQLTDFEAVEWELVTTQLVDPIAEIVIDECGWNRHTRHFEPRADRLRALVAWRLAETSTGERSGVQTVAAALGDAPDNIKCTQADLNRAMHKPGRYEQLLDAPSPGEVVSIRGESTAGREPLLSDRRAA